MSKDKKTVAEIRRRWEFGLVAESGWRPSKSES